MLLTKMRLKRLLSSLALGLLVAIAPATIATAVCNPSAQTCSPGYQVTEAFFGNGGTYADACSSGGNYCAKQASGELTVGKVCDSGDQKCLQAGFNTDRLPYLEMVVNTPNVDVGVLDPAETHVGTATFQVKSYLAEGYQVTSESVGPVNSGYTMASPITPAASAVGTEQFGMNVVANTCPASAAVPPETGGCTTGNPLGADPSQQPDSTFSFGSAATNYDVANSYMYQNHDKIAESLKSSGTTLYTITYIFNISNVTPAGTYKMNQSLVATSTF